MCAPLLILLPRCLLPLRCRDLAFNREGDAVRARHTQAGRVAADLLYGRISNCIDCACAPRHCEDPLGVPFENDMFHRLDSLAVAERKRSLVSARAAQDCPLAPAQVKYPDPMEMLDELLLAVLVEASVRPSRRRRLQDLGVGRCWPAMFSRPSALHMCADDEPSFPHFFSVGATTPALCQCSSLGTCTQTTM